MLNFCLLRDAAEFHLFKVFDFIFIAQETTYVVNPSSFTVFGTVSVLRIQASVFDETDCTFEFSVLRLLASLAAELSLNLCVAKTALMSHFTAIITLARQYEVVQVVIGSSLYLHSIANATVFSLVRFFSHCSCRLLTWLQGCMVLSCGSSPRCFVA